MSKIKEQIKVLNDLIKSNNAKNNEYLSSINALKQLSKTLPDVDFLSLNTYHSKNIINLNPKIEIKMKWGYNYLFIYKDFNFNNIKYRVYQSGYIEGISYYSPDYRYLDCVCKIVNLKKQLKNFPEDLVSKIIDITNKDLIDLIFIKKHVKLSKRSFIPEKIKLLMDYSND